MDARDLKASDVRIGNMIRTWHEDKQIHFEWEVRPGDIEQMFDNENKVLYSGVPLTPEWLERFGLKPLTGITGRYAYQNEYTPFGGCHLKDNRLWILDYTTELAQEVTSEEIQYVHQLQNLYFALTGEELN